MSHAATWAIVPVKALGDAKQRLASVLPPEARRRLMLAMLEDVLATLRHVERLAPVLVVTPDAEVAELARMPARASCARTPGTATAPRPSRASPTPQATAPARALTLPADAPLRHAAELTRPARS